MKLQDIKDAVLSGKRVFWVDKGYEVKFKFDQWYIFCNIGGHEHTIGLTWADGVTLNGLEKDFFIG